MGGITGLACYFANLAEYFPVLEETLQEHDLMNCPGCIFNMDESGIPLDHKPSKVKRVQTRSIVAPLATNHKSLLLYVPAQQVQ